MKYWRHFKYTMIHKFWVMIYCFEIGQYRRGILHDLSKFRWSEFIAYADYFFEPYVSEYRKQEKKVAFNQARLMHQNRNSHHWEHWLSVNYEGEIKSLDMPWPCIMEMVCDWRAAGKAKGTADGSWLGALQYYQQNDHRMILSDSTRNKVQYILDTEGKL